jgi:hypothetical protein
LERARCASASRRTETVIPNRVAPRELWHPTVVRGCRPVR